MAKDNKNDQQIKKGLFKVNEHRFKVKRSYIYRHYRFTRIPHYILIFQADLNITNNELAFLSHCYSFGDTCWASFDTISKRMGVHRRTVKRYAKNLSEKECVNIIYRITNGREIKVLPEFKQDIDKDWKYTSCIYDLTPIEFQAFQLAVENEMVTEEKAENEIIKRLKYQLGSNVKIQIRTGDKSVTTGGKSVTTSRDKSVITVETEVSKELYKNNQINNESSSCQRNVKAHNVDKSENRKQNDDEKIKKQKDAEQNIQNNPEIVFKSEDNKEQKNVNNTQRNSQTQRSNSTAPHEGKTQHDNMHTCSKKARQLTEHIDDELRRNGCQALSRKALERIPAQIDQFLKEYPFGLIVESIDEVVENLGNSDQSSKKISSAKYFLSTIKGNEEKWTHQQKVRTQIQQAVLRRRGTENE